MPFKSEAQRRLFYHLVKQGKLAPEALEKFQGETKKQHKKLPEYVSRKAFGGQVQAKAGTRCPACDYPLDAIPVALDAGEACPRCGYGDAKDVPHKASGGEIMDSTAYRARGGEMKCSHCGSVAFVPLKAMGGEVTEGMYGNMKEMYPSKKSDGSHLDDGKIRDFGKALRMRRSR